MYEYLIRDCDENGFPQKSECANCHRIIPTAQINLHNRQCAKKRRRQDA